MVELMKKYTYDDIVEHLQELNKRYDKITSLKIAGYSYDNRLIPLVEVGKGERCLICTGGVHGRESINPPVLLKMIEDYAEAYKRGKKLAGIYDIKKLLSEFTIVFIPLLNPDGYEIALGGFEKLRDLTLRKECASKKMDPAEWKFNGRGKDINRNFPCKSYLPKEKNDFALSEKEAKVLVSVFLDYSSIAYLDFHSRGKVIFYYRKAMPMRFNRKCKKLAKQLREVSGYSLGRMRDELLDRSSGGNTVQYYSEYLNKPAITVETVEDEAAFPMDVGLQKQTYEEIYRIPLELLSQYSEL